MDAPPPAQNAAPETANKTPVKTGEWTQPELTLLIRLMNHKFPAGTVDRWERVGLELNRATADVLKTVKALRGKRATSGSAGKARQSSAPTTTSDPSSHAGSTDTFDAEQQQALEAALRSVPASVCLETCAFTLVTNEPGCPLCVSPGTMATRHCNALSSTALPPHTCIPTTDQCRLLIVGPSLHRESLARRRASVSPGNRPVLAFGHGWPPKTTGRISCMFCARHASPPNPDDGWPRPVPPGQVPRAGCKDQGEIFLTATYTVIMIVLSTRWTAAGRDLV